MLKSWFEVMNFFIIFFLFFIFFCCFGICSVRCSSTILIMDRSTLCCMSLQSLARFMGNFNFYMQLGQLEMK